MIDRLKIGVCNVGEPIEKDEFLIHMDFLRSQLRDVIERLEVQNGRVRKGEVDIAVLKDRSPGRVAVTWGASAGAISAAVAEIIRSFIKM